MMDYLRTLTWTAIFALMMFALAACEDEQSIRAKVWNTDVGEIWRKVVVNGQPKEEFIPTNDPRFLKFKAMSNPDMEALIRAARRYCKPDKSTFEGLQFEAFLDTTSKELAVDAYSPEQSSETLEPRLYRELQAR